MQLFHFRILLFFLFMPFFVMAISTNIPNDDNQVIKYKGMNYTNLWKSVDSLNQVGLYREAYAKVEFIFRQAKEDKETEQIIKAVFYILKYLNELENEGKISGIKRLEKEVNEVGFPENALLHSILAELYSEYLNMNSWSLMDRKEVVGTLPDDINLWSVRNFEEAISFHFFKSIDYPEAKLMPLRKIDGLILNPDKAEYVFHTLYDLLVYRATLYFSKNASRLIKPEDFFLLQDTMALAPIDSFVSIHFTTSDSASFIVKALSLYQDVLLFHRYDNNPDVLIDFDIQRIIFVYQHLTHPNKREYYHKQLNYLILKYPDQLKTAEIYYLLAKEMFEQSSLAKAASLCRFAIDKYGKCAGSSLCQQLLNSIEEKHLSVIMEDYNLPNSPLLLKISFKNVKSFKGGVVPLSFKDFQQCRLLTLESDIKKFLKSNRPKNEIEVSLPDSLDYLPHETEIALDGLKEGTYIFVFKGEEMLPSFVPFQISNVGYFINNDGVEKIDFQFFNKGTTMPLAGTSVLAIPVKSPYFSAMLPEISFRDSWKKCDENGFLSFSLPKGIFDFKIANGADTFLIENQFYINEPYKENILLQLKTSIFSDRSIYRPGQTVYFKAILMEKQGSDRAVISSKKEVIISLKDPNGLILSQMSLTSNEMGSVHGSFLIPYENLKGNYHLVSSHGGNSESIQVEEYKRPQFEIIFEKSPVGVLGDSLEIKGVVAFFNGLPMENAKVKWEIIRNSWSQVNPYSDRFFSKDKGYFISSGETLTNEKGLFLFPFHAKPDLSIEPEKRPAFQFIVKVYVTAPSGEIQEKELYFQIGYAKLNLNLKLPDSWDKQKGSLDWSMFLSDWNGDQMKGNVMVSVFHLNSPRQHFVNRKWEFPDKPLLNRTTYIDLFPHLPYLGEDKLEQLEILKTISQENAEIDGEKTMNIPFQELPIGYYLVKIILPDGHFKGKDKVINKFIYLYDSKEKRISTANWVDIHLKKEIVNIRDTLVFKIAAARELKKVLIHFSTRNNIYKEWVNLEEKSEIKIPVLEKEEGVGNLEIFSYFQNEPIYLFKVVKIIYPLEKLNVTYQRFTDFVSPGELVQWEINISAENGQKKPIEAMATIFDASLESFMPHKWSMNSFQVNNYLPSNWLVTNPKILSIIAQPLKGRVRWKNITKYYPTLKDFNYIDENVYLRSLSKNYKSMAPTAAMSFRETPDQILTEKTLSQGYSEEENTTDAMKQVETVIRKDFSETVFFQPTLLADQNGDLKISFKMKDALTRWKFMLFAHQSDLNHVFSEKLLISRLPVMLQSNTPRFLREGDEMKYSVILTNTTMEDISGKLMFTVLNGSNGMDLNKIIPLEKEIMDIVVPAGKSIPVLLPLKIPADGSLNNLEITLKFESAHYSDAIKERIPIHPSKILVTDSRPFVLREKQKISFKLFNEEASSKGKYTFDFQLTTHPAWIALKSLPYLMEFPYDCNEQLFNKLYANALGTHLLTEYPSISNVLNEWKNAGTLGSALEKNEGLKTAILKETPWVSEASSEQEQRQNIARLLDVNKMTQTVNQSIKTLSERQSSEGGWSWFPGGRGNWYITQYILSGFGKLKKLGLLSNGSNMAMLSNASQYCDAEMLKLYNKIAENKKEEDFLPEIIIHYLYTQSFFKERVLSSKVKDAIAYFDRLAMKNWLKMSVYQQGQLAIYWYRSGNLEMSEVVINSLNDRSIKSDETGMSWKLNNGHHWYENKIETQSLLVEAFAETGFKSKFVSELKWSLINNKRTTHWETTKSTADAVYALLGGGEEKIAQIEQYPALVTFSNDTHKEISASYKEALKNSEAATGSIHQRWDENEIAGKGEITIENKESGFIWGAASWQYFKEISEIKTYNSPFLSVSRTLLVKKITKSGEVFLPVSNDNKLQIGDRLIVRLTIKTDRDMEYVHLNDKRASGIEPEKVLSGYTFNNGLYYYESNSDFGTDFFIDFLPKGTYSIEYPVKVNAEGIFSLGTCTMQCMYAPEFGCHTNGEKIYIGK